jgi:hypothetical protein
LRARIRIPDAHFGEAALEPRQVLVLNIFLAGSRAALYLPCLLSSTTWSLSLSAVRSRALGERAALGHRGRDMCRLGRIEIHHRNEKTE